MAPLKEIESDNQKNSFKQLKKKITKTFHSITLHNQLRNQIKMKDKKIQSAILQMTEDKQQKMNQI